MKQAIVDAVKNSEGQMVHFNQLTTWDSFATREQVNEDSRLYLDENDFVHYVGSDEENEHQDEENIEANNEITENEEYVPMEFAVTEEEKKTFLSSEEDKASNRDDEEEKETNPVLTLDEVKNIINQYNQQVLDKFEKENNDLQRVCSWLANRYSLTLLAEADGCYAFTATRQDSKEPDNIVICENFTSDVENALVNLYENNRDVKVFCLKKTDPETKIQFFVKDISSVLSELPSKKLESINLEVFIEE